ncbi:Pentatricopeptide repeat-containing protein [Rhynchospora pubera]|uniref:Pentatricopeptide repeat-containing protein n=1 Tax=Rhynchospora pubera TaxID=906938 RepID=A0AAV8G846_9POAL|nr:Pentatricopeptide repeat-containing protein [Rhynchospora pubera]
MAISVAPVNSPPLYLHKSQLRPIRKSLSKNTILTIPDFPSPSDYASAIDSCHCSSLARQIHAHVIKRRFSGHSEFLETRLLVMYGRCSCVDTACYLFYKMLLRTTYTWVAILTVLVNHGLFQKAIGMLKQMLLDGVEFNFYVFPVVLKACAGLDLVELGKYIHGLVLKTGIISNVYVGNALIDMYGKCGLVEDAMKFFYGMMEKDSVSWNSIITACSANAMVYEALKFLEEMSKSVNVEPDVVSWSSAIGGFAQNGHDEEALELFNKMLKSGVKPNSQTLTGLLPSCGRMRVLNLGKELHGYATRHGLITSSFVVNGLMDIYWRCGDIVSAERLFLKLSARNIVSYNTLLMGYSENGKLEKARHLFDNMVLDGVKRDDISWNSIISGYVDNEMDDEAINMFRKMIIDEQIKPNQYHLGSTLLACAASGTFKQGKELHSHAIVRGFTSDPFVGSALVEYYCRCNDLTAAESAFRGISERNTWNWNVLLLGHSRKGNFIRSLELMEEMKECGFEPNMYTWNGLIAGYMDNREDKLAFQLFRKLPSEGMKPDIHTIGMVLTMCSRVLSVELGKQVHAHTIRFGYDSEVRIGAPIVDMYCKCGNVPLGVLAFKRIREHNLVSYNTMLAGYATHGLGKEGIEVFNKLIKDGIVPDEITFLSVLSSCVHIGDVEQGHFYYKMMQEYSIEPNLKHYTCMVDLLSRAGQLNQAFNLIRTMPIEPDPVVWSALLNGCVIKRNIELGEIAASKLIELEEGNMANYVLLANLYAVTEKWDDLARIRGLIREKGMHKNPGCSWIEIRDTVHMFLASDESHEENHDIYALLKALHLHMKEFDGVVCI